MSCSVTSGITIDCRDDIGGIKKIFIGSSEIDLINSNTTASDANGVLTAVPSATVYEFEVRPEKCSLRANINSSPENGTVFYEQTLSFVIEELDSADQEQLELLAKGRPFVVAFTNNDDLILLGAVNGMDVSGGSAESGTGFGDFSGYNIEMRGRETDRVFHYLTAETDLSATNYPFGASVGITLAT
jgi:hypothetical protein